MPIARRAPVGAPQARVTFESGMDGYYSRFALPGTWHRSFLESMSRPGSLSAGHPNQPFVGFHVRLGDFARANDGVVASTANNTSTPISWYVSCAQMIRELLPGVPVIVASDGSDLELEALLAIPDVCRSRTKNALDEMLLLSQSTALVGSRSTFTSWAAFLGEVPLLVAPGGNAYTPHGDVTEVADPRSAAGWLERALARLQQ